MTGARQASVSKDMSNNPISESFAAIVGPKTYNKFLRSLGSARQKNRLLYWQEQLLEMARQKGLALPTALPDILAAFADARPLTIPISREEFLSKPLEYWNSEDHEIPAEWLHEAASQPHVREHLFDAVTRSASKVGDFDLADAPLEILSRVLSPPEAVDLYCYIRDNSRRLEEEWRPYFEEAFPEAVGLLPGIEVWGSDTEDEP